MTRNNDDDAVRDAVREHYASTAKDGAAVPTAKEPKDACCAPSCCGGTSSASLQMGYSSEDLANVPQGADLGLGCGNPQAMASIVPGETVLDLGAGAGFDSFLAAHRVGPDGRVIGVDMTMMLSGPLCANITPRPRRMEQRYPRRRSLRMRAVRHPVAVARRQLRFRWVTAPKTLPMCLKEQTWGWGVGTLRLWPRLFLEKRSSTLEQAPVSIVS